MIHIYHGGGKGKTTAAMGLALRAAGCGKRVVVVQFLKNGESGEIAPLSALPQVVVFAGKGCTAFTFAMDERDRARARTAHDGNLRRALDIVRAGSCDMLVLDEALDALRAGLLDENLVEKALSFGSGSGEVVLTGRSPSPALLERADYITEMTCVRHPFDRGVAARKGVEF